MTQKISIAKHFVIASEAKQSRVAPATLDCRVAALLAMTGNGAKTNLFTKILIAN
jgi:hypothetical protein